MWAVGPSITTTCVMGAAIELEILAPRDVSEPLDDPPVGVTVQRAKRSMGLGGVDVLALTLLVEAGRVALELLGTWLYDTYRSKDKPTPTVQIVINGDVHLAEGPEDVVEALQKHAALADA